MLPANRLDLLLLDEGNSLLVLDLNNLDIDSFGVGETRKLERVCVGQVVGFSGELDAILLDEETCATLEQHLAEV